MNPFRSFAGTERHRQSRVDRQRADDVDLAKAMIALHRCAVQQAKVDLITDGDPALMEATRQRMGILVGLCRGPHGDAVIPLMMEAFPEVFQVEGQA